MHLKISGNPSPEQTAAITATLAAVLAQEESQALTDTSGPKPSGWIAAARVEHLGLVRRIPGILDLRYMSAPTRERLTRRR
jgi:hypothetical protein